MRLQRRDLPEFGNGLGEQWIAYDTGMLRLAGGAPPPRTPRWVSRGGMAGGVPETCILKGCTGGGPHPPPLGGGGLFIRAVRLSALRLLRRDLPEFLRRAYGGRKKIKSAFFRAGSLRGIAENDFPGYSHSRGDRHYKTPRSDPKNGFQCSEVWVSYGILKLFAVPNSGCLTTGGGKSSVSQAN